MKVTQLTLQNFTAFDDLTLGFSPGLNVLIGANSTGKTHVLKALYVLLGACRIAFDEEGIPDAPIVGPFLSHFQKLLVEVFRPANGARENLLRNAMGQRAATSRLVVGFDDGSVMPVEIEFSWGMAASGGSPRFKVPEAIFIPPDDVMSFYRGFTHAYERRELDFDRTYYDLCMSLRGTPLREPHNQAAKQLLEPIRDAVLSDVALRGDRFYLTPAGEEPIEAQLAAEGLRRIATLVHLINNGTLTSDSVLLWDEPEANLNPRLVTVVAGLLHQLVAAGFQVFVATHDYLLTNELSLQSEYDTSAGRETRCRFFCLNRDKPGSSVTASVGSTLAELSTNPILEEFAAFYDRERTLYEQAPVKGNGET